MVFDYPQASLPPIAQPRPQVTTVFNRIMVPIPSIEISLRSEFEVYCFDHNTHQDSNRKKLIQSPGEKNYSHRLSKLIKKSKRIKRKQTKPHSIYNVSIDNFGRKHDKPYLDLHYTKNNPNSKQTQNPISISSLCDTGACRSVIPQSITRQLGLHINNSTPIHIRTANDSRVRCTGTTWMWCKHPSSERWVPVQFIVVKSAKVLILY